MATLPSAVKAAAARADDLAKKLKAGTLTAQDIPNPKAPTNPTVTLEQPPAPAPAPAPVAPAPAAVAPAPAPAPAPAQPDPFEQRYRVLQGKYDAEVPRLHEQLRGMQAHLASTQSLLSQLGSQQAVNPQTLLPPVQPLVKDSEIKEFGADLFDFIQRAAKQAVIPEVGQMVEQRITPVMSQMQQLGGNVQNVANQQQVSAEQQIFNDIDRLVGPDWETINDSPQFLEWLQVVDPYSGATRGAMLSAAFQNRDAPRVARFFNGFRQEHAAGQQPAAAAPAAAPASPQGAAPPVTLASLAAPGMGNAPPPAGTPTEAGQRVWTLPEISAFYADVQRGRYKGRQADQAAIERDIFLAQKSGRIRTR